MFLNLRSVIYKVNNLQKAKKWYARVLDSEPVVDQPSNVSFRIGNDSLDLKLADTPIQRSNSDTVVFWMVSDFKKEYNRLIEFGAKELDGIQEAGGGLLWATMKDPFGNKIGIRGLGGTPDNKAIEEKPSKTALWTTLMRAFSTREDHDEIRGRDDFAEIFLSSEQQDALLDMTNRKKMKETYFVIGVYEYVMARTRIFDHFFRQAMDEGFEQVVFLGAGYDSRSYRFYELVGDVRIFEMDMRPTQEHKKICLKKAGIDIPDQLTYVPINFNTESIKDVLFAAGYDKNKKTFFVWEGVTFYLAAEAVDDTLEFIRKNSFKGSTIAFDYIALWPGVLDAYGVKELIEFNSKNQSGESGNYFALEEGGIESFLTERGFNILIHQNTEELEQHFLTLKDGTLFGHVTGSFRIVHAMKM